MLAFLTFDREAEQYLCAAVLRPGNATAGVGTVGVLCRLLPLLRAAFPQARFLVRLDGGFATPAVFDFLDAEPRLDYVVAMAKNAVLERQAESAMQVARAQSEATGETAHVYTAARYATRTWRHERRVVIKAEVVRLGERAPRDNPRFVVTNLRQTPRFIYERVYCARGDIENRIKELLDGLQIDRTSCCRFWANQLRVLSDRRSLRADAGAAAAGGGHRVRPHPGDVATRPIAEARGPGRPLGPPARSASAAGHAAARGMAAHRPRTRRTCRIAHPSRRTKLPPGRYGPSPGEAVDIPAHRARPSPHGWPRNPLAARK